MGVNKTTKQEIFRKLASLDNVEVKNGIQLVTRCVLCGDSAKNPNKKRLGIKIDCSNPSEPILYQCFNCGETGILSSYMLREIGADDPSLIRGVKEINNNAINTEGNVKVSRYRNAKTIQVEVPPLTTNPIYLEKLKYLFSRIGKPDSLKIEDFEKLKIIWSIKDFLSVNGISPRNGYIDLLDQCYIGFLSANNEYIIFRDITEKQKMRYVKYNIFGVYDNSNSFYTIKNQINPLTTDDIHIIVSEGTFDAISLLYNVYDGDDRNKIFCATCNGQYRNTINYYVDKGLVGRNIYIDIYRDNDNDKYMNYNRLKNQLKPYTKNYRVYYNRLSKDFGVSRDKIDVDIFM